MSKITSFDQLLLHELRDLYDAESRIEKALPKMAKAADSEQLENAFSTHLEETREQIERLKRVFDILGEKPKGQTCQAAKGLIEEGEEIIKNIDKGILRDAGLIGAAQRVEHYEMAGYGTARNFAQILGHTEVVKLLDATLQQEGDTDKKLTSIAKSVNREAVRA